MPTWTCKVGLNTSFADPNWTTNQNQNTVKCLSSTDFEKTTSSEKFIIYFLTKYTQYKNVPYYNTSDLFAINRNEHDPQRPKALACEFYYRVWSATPSSPDEPNKETLSDWVQNIDTNWTLIGKNLDVLEFFIPTLDPNSNSVSRKLSLNTNTQLKEKIMKSHGLLFRPAALRITQSEL